MNWQKFIGVVMASSAGSYIVRVTDTDLKILACLIIVGIAGVVYGDAD